MAEVISNRLNVVVFPGNFKETGLSMTKNDSITVLNYNYLCQKTRNKAGIPYGNTNLTYLEFTIRNFTDKFESELLRQMHSEEANEFSFIFNAFYDEFSRISDYEDAFIARGFVMDILENFNPYKDSSQEVGQRVLKVKFLLASIIYIGSNRDCLLQINNA